MSLLEKDFEQVIFDSLRGDPLYVGFDDKDGSYTSGDYSKELHADLKLLATYIEKTQPIAWKKLQRQYPGHEAAAVAAEINKLRPKRGLLNILREGFSLAGVGKIELVTFKPATGFNPAHREKYAANRFAIVRQFHFSTAKPHDSIDLVILINGLPLLSMEVKNEFTGQTWRHAEQQYRKDRAASEPFLKACVVHFAVDNTTISMTTKLENGKTRFLPFNRDLKNPPIEGNFATAYLWEDVVVAGVAKPGVLRADSLLDLLQNYLHLEEKTDEATDRITKSLIFPRYHQLDCVRELLAQVRAHGPGDNYLSQHSAGSGKSNTIAWLAHQLVNLFTEDDQLVFDSVIIITDRRVLDKQLQETVKQFEKTAGLVQKIDQNTRQLVAALAGGAKIIVCTLQKFSWMRNLDGPKALKGKKFALIVDEAHSSQSGEGSKDLRLVLTTPEALKAIIARDEENKEWTDPVAEELALIMKGRQRLPHLSFFAFTATPKTKTLEVFGKAREVLTAGGVKKVEHKACHSYTMRQAIEEGFILDVLQSYTTYGTYFELLENAKAPPGYEVAEIKGKKLLMKHVGRHPHTIESKAKIMLDHFFTKTVHKIGGESKAMVVTSSRAHAVLYKQIFDRLLRDDYASQTQALVAFSGKVVIKGHADSYTEGGMNRADVTDIREAFKKQKYRILIVANKFQTGFDQPLLHTMYVDKKLGGVSTVQTLSRLNRKGPPAKQDTMVLDFVNRQEDIETDFQDYYGKTTLDRGTEPQKLYNLKYEGEALGVFTPEEVNEFAELFVIQKAPGQKISPLFTKIIQGKFAKLKEEDRDKFRDALRRYVSQYSFVSQIINWIDPELEKFYLFTKLLLKYLPQKKDELPEEIVNMVDMDKFRLEEKQNGSIALNPGDTELENPSGDGHGPGVGEVKEKLDVIVKELNEKFHFDFEDRDKVLSIVIPKLARDAGLIAAFQTNNLETLRKQKFADSLENAFISSAGDFYSVLNRMSAEPDFKRVLTEFALTEFRRGLTAPNVIAFRPRIVKPGPQERYVTCVPFVPLKAAAGAFGDAQHINDGDFEWTAIETRHRLRPGMFVAQVVGTSMVPTIPDGAYCLFAAPVEGTRQGKTVLVQLRDASDPATGERYTVKRYESKKAKAGDTWRHEKITLKPINPDFKPIILTGADEGQLQVIAELIEVLGCGP